MPGKMRPTLAILIAPPAVAMLAWLQLNGGALDALVRVFYALTLLFAALFAVQAPALRSTPFALSWWAMSFPVAALTVATLGYADLIGSNLHRFAGAVCLVLLAGLVTGLLLRTAVALVRGEITRPD
jgi:Tellurite resistance protein and related permeases